MEGEDGRAEIKGKQERRMAVMEKGKEVGQRYNRRSDQ